MKKIDIKSLVINEKNINYMKRNPENIRTIKLINCNYNGHDFCGEFSPAEVSRIISEQPTELTFKWELYAGWSSDIEEIVSAHCDENGLLTPISFDLDLVD
jgi:hypothetical protein